MSDETDFASPTNINWQGTTGIVEYGGGDRGMVAMFYNRPMPNPAKARETGHPFFEDQVYIRVHPPGERLNIVDRKATDVDRRRWPMQWQQFQQNKQQQPEGAPIELLYPEYPSVAAMLRANAVMTIEQCAELSGTAIDAIGMGSQRYVNAAKKWLEAANKGVKASQMIHELEERDREIKVLKSTVEKLMVRVEELTQNNLAQPNLAQLQTLIAGAMSRPQHMPNQAFDPQTAMINATSPTSLVEQGHKPKRRARPRVTG
jgi:hypothetical protein